MSDKHQNKHEIQPHGFDSFFGNGQIEKMIKQLFNEPFLNVFNEDISDVSIFDTGQEVVVKASIPGYSSEQVHVETMEKGLRIFVEDQQELSTVDEKRQFFKQEKSYKQIEKRVLLPHGLPINQAHATFNDGLLEVRIPKQK